MRKPAAQGIDRILREAVDSVAITDVHTHLFSPAFGSLLLWGIDELLTYHYLVAEMFRNTSIPYDRFWSMSKRQQADFIWQTLFIENSPYSEATRGVLTVLRELGLDTATRDLGGYREYFESKSVEEYLDIVFSLSGVECAVMTNDPFVEAERTVWMQKPPEDPRFKAVLRVDTLLNTWEFACATLASRGYQVDSHLSKHCLSEVRRFLSDWIKRMNPLYMAVSLPPDFSFPDESPRGVIIQHCILPLSRERNIPFAMMIGVKKLVHPDLRLAGDSVGKAHIDVLETLCSRYPSNKFLVTMLARENQHELAVAARKYRNLMIFGCWWFLNNPSLIEEITRMRCELLGPAFIPQHSDARVLDQIVYKWGHSKDIICRVLTDKYRDLQRTGWIITEDEIKRDVEGLFSHRFWRFLELDLH